MTVSRIRAAITEASRDTRITEAEAKRIVQAATLGADGKPDGLSLAEARALASFVEGAKAPTSTVKLGAPAQRAFDSLFSSSAVPVGHAKDHVIRTLGASLPFAPGPKLARAPSVGSRFELPLGQDPELPDGPQRTAYFDPGKKDFFLKLTKGRSTSWVGPLPMFRTDDAPRAEARAFGVTATGGVKLAAVANSHAFELSGGLRAGATLTLDFGDGTKVALKGPLAKSYDVFRALDAALPRGTFARTSGKWMEEYIAERPATDTRVISVWKGDRPGEMNQADLLHARTLRRLLADVPKGSSTTAAARPSWDSRAGLYRANKGAGASLFKVPLASGKVALVDPKANQVFFATEGARRALSAVTGPVALHGGPAAFSSPGRFFTWSELKLLEARATNG